MPEPVATPAPAVVPEPAPVVPATPEKAEPAEKLYTKAERDAAIAVAVKDRLGDTDLKALRDRAKRADELEAERLSDVEKAEKAAADEKARADKAEADLAAERLSALRMRIGTEKGLHVELAARLVGDDEATIMLDADKLLAVLPKTGASPGGANPANATATDINTRYAEAVRRNDAPALIAIEMERTGRV